MKWRTSLTTPRLLNKETRAPEYDEPILRDRIRPTNGLYTPKSGEGVLPSCVVVIPDTTKSMYSVKQNDNIFDLYAIGSQKKKEPGETSIPFIHGVELSGPKGETVRFRSMFDNGALANAIDKKMYLMTTSGSLTLLQGITLHILEQNNLTSPKPSSQCC